ncbi:hypothetical protein ACHAXT_003802 [Thalassiosira profunda]
MLDVLDLAVYWISAHGTPFLDLAFPVLQDKRLTDLVREEVLRKDPSKGDVDFVLDVKSATTRAGKDVSRMLGVPASSFFAVCKNDVPKTLIVVIDKPTPDVPKKKETGWEKMAKASNRSTLSSARSGN